MMDATKSAFTHTQGDELLAVLVADSNNLDRNGFTSAPGSGDEVSPSQEGVPILSVIDLRGPGSRDDSSHKQGLCINLKPPTHTDDLP